MNQMFLEAWHAVGVGMVVQGLQLMANGYSRCYALVWLGQTSVLPQVVAAGLSCGQM